MYLTLGFLFFLAVLFVIDPTGLSGEKSTIEAQLNVRKMLKERFPRRPWLDVISKGMKQSLKTFNEKK